MYQKFEGTDVFVYINDGKILFSTEDVAIAVGYSKLSSLDHHIKGTKKDIQLGLSRYMDIKGIKYLAKRAYRTPAVKRFAAWAAMLVNKNAEVVVPVEVVDVKMSAKLELIGIKAAAVTFGMTAKELSDWLVDRGYAGRYVSNQHIFWTRWFRDQDLGATPTISDERGTRSSNTAKLTNSGMEFVKNRLSNQRDSGVLAFAKKEANERVELEKALDSLITETFKRELDGNSLYNNAFGNQYKMSRSDLLKRVKEVIAQVKLKEKT